MLFRPVEASLKLCDGVHRTMILKKEIAGNAGVFAIEECLPNAQVSSYLAAKNRHILW